MDVPSPPGPAVDPPDRISAAFAALILALRAEAMDAEEAGRREDAERASRYRSMIIGVRDRWTANEASPARTRGAASGG